MSQKCVCRRSVHGTEPNHPSPHLGEVNAPLGCHLLPPLHVRLHVPLCDANVPLACSQPALERLRCASAAALTSRLQREKGLAAARPSGEGPPRPPAGHGVKGFGGAPPCSEASVQREGRCGVCFLQGEQVLSRFWGGGRYVGEFYVEAGESAVEKRPCKRAGSVQGSVGFPWEGQSQGKGFVSCSKGFVSCSK
eukprot:140586-Chlamydomonas_euryale.AAC.1